MPTAKAYNLARMYTTTTGTGTVTLTTAVSGFLTFAQAGVQNSDVVTYAIKDGTNSEIGRGTYTSSGTTLSRTTVLASTNSNNLLNLASTGSGAEVFLTPAAEDFDISNFTTETAPAIGDLLWLYDLSATAKRGMTLSNMLKVINGLTEDTTPVAGDFLISYDTSATDVRKVNVNEFLLVGQNNTVTGSNTFNGGVQVVDPDALTHNTSWDGTAIQAPTVTVNGSSFTIANPSSATTAALYLITINYTTSHSVSWGTNFKGVSGITPTATSGAVDFFIFRWSGSAMQLVGYSLNAGA